MAFGMVMISCARSGCVAKTIVHDCMMLSCEGMSSHMVTIRGWDEEPRDENLPRDHEQQLGDDQPRDVVAQPRDDAQPRKHELRPREDELRCEHMQPRVHAVRVRENAQPHVDEQLREDDEPRCDDHPQIDEDELRSDLIISSVAMMISRETLNYSKMESFRVMMPGLGYMMSCCERTVSPTSVNHRVRTISLEPKTTRDEVNNWDSSLVLLFRTEWMNQTGRTRPVMCRCAAHLPTVNIVVVYHGWRHDRASISGMCRHLGLSISEAHLQHVLDSD
ncbi:unnamed protein product [Prorocentrum cordatum]|uniref:Uncharacterized protein n=1 Tax=Prorocentrum cordatum TaxID=2364126 RepID=A0ABN9SDB1_9DINO|nr:unnamed protein product [Polarella glacialis]